MTTALQQQTGFNVNEWQVLQQQAGMLIKTGFLPPSIKTPEQVIAIAITGRELGIGMMEAIRGINVIQGKPSVSPQLMLALARRTGEVEKFSLHAIGKPASPVDANGAECHIKRKGNQEHVTIFGPTEAKALGLSGKDNYQKQAAIMYQWRALAANLRITFPDAISGLYTPEELDANLRVDDEGSLAEPVVNSTIAMPKERAVEPEPVKPVDSAISDSERALLFKVARSAWGNDAEAFLRNYIRANFLTEHTSELTPEQYAKTLQEIKEIAETAASTKGELFD